MGTVDYGRLPLGYLHVMGFSIWVGSLIISNQICKLKISKTVGFTFHIISVDYLVKFTWYTAHQFFVHFLLAYPRGISSGISSCCSVLVGLLFLFLVLFCLVMFLLHLMFLSSLEIRDNSLKRIRY